MNLPRIGSALVLGAVMGVAGAEFRGPSPEPPSVQIHPDGATTEEYRDWMRRKGDIVLLKRFAPSYPVRQARSREAGCVVIQFEVGTDGRPDRFRVLNSIPEGAFDQAALAALNLWEFEPVSEPRPAIQSFEFEIDGRKDERSVNKVPVRSRRVECPLPDVNLDASGSLRGVVSVKKFVAPYFPPEAVKENVSGCVAVSFDVGPDGRADNYEVLQSQPDGVFDKAATWGLTHTTFQPAEDTVRAAAVYSFYYRYGGTTRGNASAACSLPRAFSIPWIEPGENQP